MWMLNFLFIKFLFLFALLLYFFSIFRDVAQPGSAHVWGAWGRKFESCHPDFKGQNGVISVLSFFQLDQVFYENSFYRSAWLFIQQKSFLILAGGEKMLII